MSKNFSNHEASSLIEDDIQDPDVVKLQNRTKSFEEAMHKPVSSHVDKLDVKKIIFKIGLFYLLLEKY